MAPEVFEVTGKNPLLEIAVELERIALEDDYFVSRKLYSNVDFYSGIIFQVLEDPEQKIARPRQIYVGSDARDYVPMSDRR